MAILSTEHRGPRARPGIAQILTKTGLGPFAGRVVDTEQKSKKKGFKMKAKQWFGIARIVIKALKVALGELAEARAPDSPAGAKVTREEAEEVAAAALSSILDDIAGILTNA
jgi:hypothetical protein